jgi:hypothetical protein
VLADGQLKHEIAKQVLQKLSRFKFNAPLHCWHSGFGLVFLLSKASF